MKRIKMIINKHKDTKDVTRMYASRWQPIRTHILCVLCVVCTVYKIVLVLTKSDIFSSLYTTQLLSCQLSVYCTLRRDFVLLGYIADIR